MKIRLLIGIKWESKALDVKPTDLDQRLDLGMKRKKLRMRPIPCTKMFARIVTLSRICQSWVQWYKPVPALWRWMDEGGPNGHSLLLSELKASLSNMRPCLRRRGSGAG